MLFQLPEPKADFSESFHRRAIATLEAIKAACAAYKPEANNLLLCPACGSEVSQRFGRHERLYLALHDCRDGCHIGRGATPEIATEYFLSTFAQGHPVKAEPVETEEEALERANRMLSEIQPMEVAG